MVMISSGLAISGVGTDWMEISQSEFEQNTDAFPGAHNEWARLRL